MFDQTFQFADLGIVAVLVLLEGLLSADNALVLAIMVRHLPREEQKKALLYGLGGAFVFRFVAILFAAIVLAQWWLQAVGAIYLLFLPIKHFIQHSGNKEVKPVGAGFWQTVFIVELTDIAFAVDSVLAGVTLIGKNPNATGYHPKLWVVYLGAIIGIVLLRIAAGMFIRILEKYPVLDHVAYIIVGWVGVKLGFLAGHTFNHSIPEMNKILFWVVLLVIAAIGTVVALRNPAPPEDQEALADQAEVIADIQDEPEPEKS